VSVYEAMLQRMAFEAKSGLPRNIPSQRGPGETWEKKESLQWDLTQPVQAAQSAYASCWQAAVDKDKDARGTER